MTLKNIVLGYMRRERARRGRDPLIIRGKGRVSSGSAEEEGRIRVVYYVSSSFAVFLTDVYEAIKGCGERARRQSAVTKRRVYI